MEEYKLKGGAVMTDADFERLSAEVEDGNYPGTPGEWVVRPHGSSKLKEDVKTVTKDDVEDIRRIAQEVIQKYPNTLKLLEDN